MNNEEARFIKQNLQYYLFCFYYHPSDKFISFEEYLLFQLYDMYEQGLFVKKDIYNIIYEYEKFINDPTIIKEVFETDKKLLSNKKLNYYHFQEEADLWFEKVVQKSKKEQELLKGLDLYKKEEEKIRLLAGKIIKANSLGDIDSILIDYFNLIRKIRDKNKITPIDIYLNDTVDEINEKYKNIYKNISEVNYDFYTEEAKERIKFNKANQELLKWLLYEYSKTNDIDLNFYNNKKQNISYTKKYKN